MNDGKATKGAQNSANQRVDKWLWYIRAVKTRTLATDLVSHGKVRINRQPITKPSQLVKPGDVITVSIRGRIRVIEVIDPGQRRGPADEASQLYRELTETTPASGPTDGDTAPPAERVPGAGRPTKRERRQIDNLTGRRK